MLHQVSTQSNVQIGTGSCEVMWPSSNSSSMQTFEVRCRKITAVYGCVVEVATRYETAVAYGPIQSSKLASALPVFLKADTLSNDRKNGNKCSKCWTAQMHFHCIPGFSMPWFATRHNTKGDGPASSHLHKCLTMRNGRSAILHTLGRSKKSLSSRVRPAFDAFYPANQSSTHLNKAYVSKSFKIFVRGQETAKKVPFSIQSIISSQKSQSASHG